MKKINQKLLNRLVQLASKKLSGDWILIGGTLLPFLGIEYRSTEDVDFVGFGPREQAQNLDLLEIAQELGLPVASINQAGGLFLKKIPAWKKHIHLIAEGPTAKIFRPTASLFVLLKINRLSETDLQDCIEFLKYAKRNREQIDSQLVLKAIEAKRRATSSTAMLDRLEKLANVILHAFPLLSD